MSFIRFGKHVECTSEYVYKYVYKTPWTKGHISHTTDRATATTKLTRTDLSLPFVVVVVVVVVAAAATHPTLSASAPHI
jgi:hypothetical protein